MIDHKLVYLITLPYLNEIHQRKGVQSVCIQRLSENSWVPLFHVDSGAGKIVTCSVRAMAKSQVRSWDNLNLLCEWIRNHFKIYFADLSMANAEIKYQGEDE